MNPKNISDARAIVWTVSVDTEARKVERNYCLYRYGQLYMENMTVEEFLAEWDILHKARRSAELVGSN